MFARAYSSVVVDEVIEVGVERVFATLADPTTYPEWLAGTDRIRGIDRSFPAAGSSFAHSVGLGGPLTVDDRTESIGAAPDRHLALRVHAGVFHARVDFELFPEGTDRTRVRFSEQPIGPARPLLPLLRPILYLRNRGSLHRLHQLLTALS